MPLQTKLLCAAGAVLLFAAPARAQTNLAGHWEGSFTVRDQQVAISLDLARNEKSEWVASMGVPREHVTGLVVKDVTVSGYSLKFVAVELGMARFELTIGSDATMKGTVANGRQDPASVEFKRTGEAKVELIPASPAVSKELEGDWEGALQMGPRPFRIIVHFKNRPDKSVEATIDTPDSGAMGLPLNDVKQDGRAVNFGVRIAHSQFQGTLNQEGTELAGQWGHDGNGAPLTFQKKKS